MAGEGGAAGTGGMAGEGGAAGAAGLAGMSTGGAAGAASMCNENENGEGTPTKVCFHPDGTMVNPLEAGGGGASFFYPQCQAMKRDASAACPPATSICGWNMCGQRLVVAGDATSEGDDCCYDGAICYTGTNECGRPLIVAGGKRAARLVRGPGW
jgi:hypothetical protein